jgi:Phasin protein
MGIIMDEVRKPEWALPDLGASFVQATSEATQRFCEQGQTVAKTCTEWNAEINQFVSRRVARNSETISRVSKCQNFPEVFAIQAQWLQDATDDYMKEMSKLVEVNSRVMGGLLATVEQFRERVSTETRSTLPAKVPTPAAAG